NTTIGTSVTRSRRGPPTRTKRTNDDSGRSAGTTVTTLRSGSRDLRELRNKTSITGNWIVSPTVNTTQRPQQQVLVRFVLDSLEVRGHNITTRTRATIFHTARILTAEIGRASCRERV